MKKILYFVVFLTTTICFSQDILMENGSFNRCAPDMFYDSGGEFGNYENDENLVTTICPQNTDEFIILNFTLFTTQTGINADVMNIYDGVDTSASLIGTYVGPVGAFMVSASDANTSGCLTVEFISNDNGNVNGWEAEILCAAPCQDILASIDSTIPEVNGSGVIGILPGESVDFSGSGTFSVDGTNATYNWDFGDGNTAIGSDASNVFATAGTYTVALTVTDDNPQGCSGIATVTVFVLGPNVVVDQVTFTPEQLIEDVLVNSPCASVSNIEWSTGISFSPTQPNGIGYFFGDGISFPFEEGVLLTSGDASRAGGPNVALGDGTSVIWPGDAELDETVGINSNNASYIKFDFTPLADTISFDFIMASEEYNMGSFECDYSDAFAFLLTDSMGNTTNLAVIPGTTTPILVTEIHPDNGAYCGGANEQYFGGYTAQNDPPTSFDGRTVVFTAQSDVIPGDVYTIKLVIADATDSDFDSGVFLRAGSFDLGGDLGDDITILQGTAECDGTSITLDTGVPLADHVWYYAADAEMPDDRVEISGETSSILSVTESGMYFVDVVFTGVCQSSDFVIIEFKPSPIANLPDNLIVCDSDGIADFDLSVNDSNILGTQNAADFIISYHLTEQDAIDNNPALPNTYTSNSQVIWARIGDTTQECFDTTSFSINVVGQPTINLVPDLELCDDSSNNDLEEFDLRLQTLDILGGQSATDFTVTYHLSDADADLGIGALPNLYTNSSNPEPIYVRVERAGNSSCYNASVNPVFNLVVNTRAIANTPIDMVVCDDPSNDGIATFNLSTQEFEILGSQDATVFTVVFFGSLADAEANNLAAALPTSYTNSAPNLEPVYVRVEDPLYPDCYGITTFNIIVNPLPLLVAPTPLEVCDDGTPDGSTEIDLSLKNTQVTGNNPNYSVSYYLTQAEADSGMTPLPILYTNTSNNQIIYARVEDNITSCYDTTTLELIVQQAPIAFTPQPLRYCDPDNDGFGVFTLTDADNEITAGASGLTVSYHETLVNAENNVGAIDTTLTYNNIVVDTQTLYVRIESATITTDCATLVELELIVEPTPQLVDPTPLEACDDISADGFASFDLTTKSDELLNGQDPAQYIVSYYATQANAELANNPITNTAAFTNTIVFNQIIWIRVEDNTTVEGCFKLTSLELIVNPLPVLVAPAPLELCDAVTLDDEKEGFDLEDANVEILNGQTGLTLTYYETQIDADNATSPIVSPYINTSNPQTIFVRAQNDITSCYNTITVTLRVNPLPSPEPNPNPIEVCDDDNDGFAQFDLDQRTIEISNAEPGVLITYHETQSEADTADNPIIGLYTNIVANNQMIYVRSENSLTGCYSLTTNTLELIVLLAPEVPTDLAPYIICDTNDDGLAAFDLTTKTDEILNGQDSTEVSLTYHVSAADAEIGNNPIINTGNYTNTINPQVIYVRLFNPTTGCQDTGEFELQVELPPVAVQPTQLNVCDDLGEVPGDEITAFDLTVKDVEITGGNSSWSVAYYETDAEAQMQTNVIPDPTQYTNTSVAGLSANPQTLYVVITDTDTGCVDFTTLTIRVLPNPTPTPSDQLPDLVLCDEVNTGDGQEVFDLTENGVLILGGEAGVTATYHETAEDADSGSNPIADPTQYTNTEVSEQELYVRVTNDITGCYALVNFTLIVHPLPAVVAVTDFIQCELNTDGVDSFDLITKNEEILNGQDPTQYLVSYHENLADAEAGMNGLVSPYTNITNPQQIFVTITNNITDCSISTQSFNIEVQEAAEANADLNPIVYEQCDDTMETDGDPSNDSVQFDLTTQDDDVLDGQDPVNYIVTYYATEADANLKVNSLPTLYENITNPQVIYARVDNDTPDAITGDDTSICYAVAPLTLQVNPLPEFDLEDRYTLCINTNGTEILAPLVIDTGLSTTAYSFEWSYNATILPTETGSRIMPTQGGTYSVIVTDISSSTVTNCINADTTEVIESEPPLLEVNLVTQAFSDNHVIEAIATALGDSDSEYEYSLDGGPWQDSGTFSNVSAGSHEITARDKAGCGITAAPIFVIDYPLYFTPNGDGNNETWNIPGIGSTAKIYIFDRYGKLLKQLSPTGSGWDGTYNGNMMPTSDYWFTVQYIEPSTDESKEFKAHFTLKR